MYLNRLKIRKFRSINEMDIHFNKGLNVIVGENNCGKTAIIDALRIALSVGKQWRDIGVDSEEDFFIDSADFNKAPEPIEFDLHFTIEAEEDRELFTSMLWQDPANADNQDLQMHFRYEIEQRPNGTKKLRWSSWGGEIEGQAIDPNEAQLLYYTYLAPLRNAEQELRPYAKDNKVTSLFRELTSYSVKDAAGGVTAKALDEPAKVTLAGKLEAVINDEDWIGLINTGANHVNEHLEKADINKKGSRVHLSFLEYKFENIIKGIVTKKPVYDAAILIGGNEHKQRYFDVSQNGLGENNLIFAAAVLGDLKNRRAEKKEHYYSLLIEEPEAHLHPQKQNTFFNYLNNLQELGLQIFITSHSPTLTAKSDLNNLIVIQQQPNRGNPFTVKHSELTDDNKAYLRKFLDVTKSQLFFSNGTILVEGISESLLVPVFAKMMGKDFDLDKNGIEVVNVGGIAFEPFAKLYNSADKNKRLPSKCAILTDDDRGNLAPAHFINDDQGITKTTAKQIFAELLNENVIDSSNRIITEQGVAINLDGLNHHAAFVTTIIDARRNQISSRANNANLLAAHNLSTRLAVYTFEYELMIASELNYRIMMALYRKMHPRTDFMPILNNSLKNRALEFVAKLDANKDKSEFAERLAFCLSNKVGRTRFTVPTYIQDAINWVI